MATRRKRKMPLQDPETRMREMQSRIKEIQSLPKRAKGTSQPSRKAIRAKLSTTNRDVRRRAVEDPNKDAIERVRGDRLQKKREANRRSAASQRGARKRNRG